MDLLVLLLPALVVCWVLKTRQQRQRIALLARWLAPYNIEKHIETVTQGYSRALGEADPHRQEQVWGVLQPSEAALSRQMGQLADAVAAEDPAATRVSRLPIWTPLAVSAATGFDLREALRIHAQGIRRAVESNAGSARDRAYAISAELLLMQHTCHWFCRSKAVASARLQARHRTGYEQVLASVLPQTRNAYLRLVGGAAAS